MLELGQKLYRFWFYPLEYPIILASHDLLEKQLNETLGYYLREKALPELLLFAGELKTPLEILEGWKIATSTVFKDDPQHGQMLNYISNSVPTQEQFLCFFRQKDQRLGRKAWRAYKKRQKQNERQYRKSQEILEKSSWLKTRATT
jgi:hypothetical protein